MFTIPSHIFIIPYRDRDAELEKWQEIMVPYLNNQLGEDKYKILVVHQLNNKLFNRGGLCNIGFLHAKKEYPENYKDIQLIFHDVDIYPIKKDNEKDIIKYSTKKNEACHPYGELLKEIGGTLGTICIIYGEDYEKVNGHPNYYGWGSEDVCFARRCTTHGIRINEDNILLRWKNDDKIVDIHSHQTPANIKFIHACNKINVKKMLIEDHQKSSNGLNNIRYSIIEKKNINDLQNWFMLNVNFTVL